MMRAQRDVRVRGTAAGLVLALLAAAGCAGPVVKVQKRVFEPGALAVVAVVPFVPGPRFAGSPEPDSPSAAQCADLVGRFVSEALADEDVQVVPPNDVLVAFEARGLVVPRAEPAVLASVAADEFGATSVLLGTVGRYVERRGEALGALRPASVSFELSLYSAPGAELLWKARVDETQHTFTDNVSRALDYPGRGTRWLTAAELARWAAGHAAEALGALR